MTVGTRTHVAARTMSEAKVSSAFVIDGGKPVGVVSQGDLLGLAVGAAPKAAPGGRLRCLRADPLSAGAATRRPSPRLTGSSRRALVDFPPRQTAPPRAEHQPARDPPERGRDGPGPLQTEQGILYASITDWNYYAGIAALMDELSEQARRSKDDARQKRRRGSAESTRAMRDDNVGDDELEAQIRAGRPGAAPPPVGVRHAAGGG